MVISLKILQGTSHVIMWLVFSFLIVSCKENKKEDRQISIEWEANKAVAISIPEELLNGIPPDDARKLLRVQLENTDVDMLGNNFSTIDAVIFRPIVAFTPGLKYDVLLSGRLITNIDIPQNGKTGPPHIVYIYPSGSPLPENLLKMYIEFSKPMQEGHAMENIVVVRNNKDTVPVFLDLQQELWNKEGTILTLWFDPGRIKRGLQPNARSGIPLRQGDTYKILINNGWRDIEGLPLPAHVRFFNVGPRDNVSPSIDRWEMILPKATKKESLKIKLHEQLDYLLLKNTVSIKDSIGNSIHGVLQIEEDETGVVFIPAVPWMRGNYTLEVEARLEDLAGNNLNRLFDRDITQKNNGEQKNVYKRTFVIQ